MTREEIIAGTLAWCNERRAEKGQEPLTDLPKGVRGDGYSCPCGAACGFWVGYRRYYASQNSSPPLGDIPEAVSAFVSGFDGGGLSEYEL